MWKTVEFIVRLKKIRVGTDGGKINYRIEQEFMMGGGMNRGAF